MSLENWNIKNTFKIANFQNLFNNDCNTIKNEFKQFSCWKLTEKSIRFKQIQILLRKEMYILTVFLVFIVNKQLSD